MIKEDYANGQLLVQRSGKTVHTFKFVEICTARKFEEVTKQRNLLAKIARGEKKVDEAKMREEEIKFYDLVTQSGLENPLDYESALDTFTPAELGALTEEVYSFLINFSSIDEVKQYASRLAEIEKKEKKAQKSSQK